MLDIHSLNETVGLSESMNVICMDDLILKLILIQYL